MTFACINALLFMNDNKRSSKSIGLMCYASAGQRNLSERKHSYVTFMFKFCFCDIFLECIRFYRCFKFSHQCRQTVYLLQQNRIICSHIIMVSPELQFLFLCPVIFLHLWCIFGGNSYFLFSMVHTVSPWRLWMKVQQVCSCFWLFDTNITTHRWPDSGEKFY